MPSNKDYSQPLKSAMNMAILSKGVFNSINTQVEAKTPKALFVVDKRSKSHSQDFKQQI